MGFKARKTQNTQIQKYAAQGDVLFLRVSKLPKKAVRKSDNIIAHSETGHHHVANGCDAYEMPDDPMVCYLVAEGSIEIEHRRPWDTHAPLMLGGGVWQVRRQREHTPEGWRRVED